MSLGPYIRPDIGYVLITRPMRTFHLLFRSGSVMNVTFIDTWLGLLHFLSKVIAKETKGKNRGHPDEGRAHAFVEATEDTLVLDGLGDAVPHARVHGLFARLRHGHGLESHLDGVERVAGEDGRHASRATCDEILGKIRHPEQSG